MTTLNDLVTNPPSGKVCIPVDWSCYGTPEEISNLDPAVKTRAEIFAQRAIRILTGFQAGNCPVTVRPCSQSWLGVPGFLPENPGIPWMIPYIVDGRWYNACTCRGSCGCESLTTIRLEGPVGHLMEVKIDGQVVAPTMYRVDNGNELVRLGGPEWPAAQDLELADSEIGTMSITYIQGVAIDTQMAFVAGILAKEFAKACAGSDCALPSNIVSLSRNGVDFEFGEEVFSNGLTGIKEVDIWVRSLNPYGVRATAAVFSPDVEAPRRTTWSA